jgi:hypothetical protein
MQSTNEKVSGWFERNISVIQLDSVDPSLGVLVGYLVEMNGLDWFKERFALRRASVKQRDFARAMTVGTNTKPIELHVNTPVRYISDILAWLHEAFASELDLIDLLLEDFDRKLKASMTSGILTPVSADVGGCIENVFGGLGSVSEFLNVLLLLKYYEEWFRGQDADGAISAVLGKLAVSLEPRKAALLDALYDDCLAESIDKQKLLPTPGLKYMLEELVGLDRVQRSCLGPRNYDEVYARIQEDLVALMNRMFKIYLNSLDDFELDILQLNCFDHISAQMPLPEVLEKARVTALTSVSSQLIARLFGKAMLDVSLLETEVLSNEQAVVCLKHLNETFVINSGWDFPKSEPRIYGICNRKYLAQTCSNRLVDFYTKLFEQVSKPDPGIKSPATIKMLLFVDETVKS